MQEINGSNLKIRKVGNNFGIYVDDILIQNITITNCIATHIKDVNEIAVYEFIGVKIKDN